MVKKASANNTMIYTGVTARKARIPKQPILLVLVSAFMVPIAGTGYLPIIMAYLFLFQIINRNQGTLRIQSSYVRIYAKWTLILLFISIITGFLSGVSPYSMFTDIVTSLIPLVCMIIGSEYAVSLSERHMSNVILFVLLIETLVGLGQTVNPQFREITFRLYGAQNRLISYVAEDVGRAVGTIGSPNYYGLVCLFMGVVALIQSMDLHRKKLTLLTVLMVLLCVIFSVSKTCIICLGVTLVLWVLSTPSIRPFCKTLLIAISVLLIIFGIQWFEQYSNRIINITSMTGRTDSWQSIFRRFSSGNFFNQLIGYGKGYANVHNLGSYVDSYYLLLFVEYGYLGVLVYAGIWSALIWKVLKSKKTVNRETLLILIIITLLADVTAAVSDNSNTSIIFYLLIGRYFSRNEIATIDRLKDK